MLYFDHAATSFPKLPAVGQAMADLLANAAVNPGRGGYQLSIQLSNRIDRFRQKLARHYQIQPAEHVVFTSNCTDALNLAIHGWLSTATQESAGFGPLPEVVTTLWEHNSVLRPLFDWRDRGLIQLHVLETPASGQLSYDTLAEVMNDHTCLVAISQVSNTTGVRQKLRSIGDLVKHSDARLLVDAAQSAGHELTRMSDWHVDMLAMAGHKGWGGPTGIGALLLGDRMFDAEGRCLVKAQSQGGTGGQSVSETQPLGMPMALESGTLNTVGIAGWEAAFDHVMREWAIKQSDSEHAVVSGTALRMKSLADQLTEVLDDLPGCEVYGPKDRDHSTGIVLFNFKDRPADEAEQIMDSVFQIAVRSGLHCAPKAHEFLGTLAHGAIRVAFGPEHSEDDLQTLIEAIREIEGS